MARYINPYTDFGFKRLFGTEANKDLLMDFLNELVSKEHKIEKLSFNDKEQLGFSQSDRKAIFDIYCTTQSGEKIIIEMQKAKVNFFKDRTVFYSSFPISEQAKKGGWNFELKAVYCIAILDFEFDKNEGRENYKSVVTLKDQECREFYKKLKYIFIEMPKFKKKENELESHFDKWLYFLKHLVDFEDIPAVLNKPIFKRGFIEAELTKLSHEEQENYQKSFLTYCEITSVEETAFEEGLEKGIQKGIQKGIEETAKKMILDGLALDVVSKYTGLAVNKLKATGEKE